MVALAVRLALAETALADGEAPLLLDDPLVDMDPERRAAAAGAIAEYASRHQVVLFTCHPDHANLFPDAHRIELARPTGS
ncbi:MAG: ATP-binding protein, partial [Spirochaetota bacterium]